MLLGLGLLTLCSFITDDEIICILNITVLFYNDLKFNIDNNTDNNNDNDITYIRTQTAAL